jgi:hypothetical protein
LKQREELRQRRRSAKSRDADGHALRPARLSICSIWRRFV